jgi:hypothetical protein
VPAQGFTRDWDLHVNPNGLGITIASNPYHCELVTKSGITRRLRDLRGYGLLKVDFRSPRLISKNSSEGLIRQTQFLRDTRLGGAFSIFADRGEINAFLRVVHIPT